MDDNIQSPQQNNSPELDTARDATSVPQGPVVHIAHLQDVLSPAAFAQLMRLQCVFTTTRRNCFLTIHREADFGQLDHARLESEFAAALRELDRVESSTAFLYKAYYAVKRGQVCASFLFQIVFS